MKYSCFGVFVKKRVRRKWKKKNKVFMFPVLYDRFLKNNKTQAFYLKEALIPIKYTVITDTRVRKPLII